MQQDCADEMGQLQRAARHGNGTGRCKGRCPFPFSRADTPTTCSSAGDTVVEQDGVDEANTQTQRDSRSLHLLEVCDMRLPWIDEQLLSGARMHLEVKSASRRVFPRLRSS